MEQVLYPGDSVVTVFGDPDLPEGSVGTVRAVHGDPFDGVDVVFGSEVFNVVATGLEPSTASL
ncbi:hypothetical protein ACIPH4_34265 [Streptomyces tendae]|uniref:hypothetical protein n=1 Tax=Streptomyces tendae TaxID=1932 RepID=UPI0038302BAC